MQRLDVFNWKEAEDGEIFKGRMHLRGSAPFAAFLTVEGFEVLAGYGAEIDVTFEGTGKLRLERPKGVSVWSHSKTRQGYEPAGEVYTNVDRKPSDSAAVSEVKKALRELELMKRSALSEIRAAKYTAKAEKAAKKAEKAEAELSEVEAEAKAKALEGEAE